MDLWDGVREKPRFHVATKEAMIPLFFFVPHKLLVLFSEWAGSFRPYWGPTSRSFIVSKYKQVLNAFCFLSLIVSKTYSVENARK